MVSLKGFKETEEVRSEVREGDVVISGSPHHGVDVDVQVAMERRRALERNAEKRASREGASVAERLEPFTDPETKAERRLGRVGGWRVDKGFGFLNDVQSGQRVFIHRSEILGMVCVRPNQR